VKVNTRGKGGRRLKKNISVYTSDGNESQHQLVIGGLVKNVFLISKKRIKLRGPAGSEITETTSIVPLEEYRFSITDAELKSGRYVELSWHAYQDKSGTAFRIQVRNLKKKKGRYSDKIILTTDSSIRPVIQVDVIGSIE